VVLNIIRPSSQVPVTLGQIMVSQVPDQTFGLLVKVLGEANLLRYYHFEDLIRVFVHEWTPANHHFVDEHAKSIPVNGLTMTFVKDNLWSKVLWRTTQSVGPLSTLQLLEETKVRELQVATLVKKDVFWL
jgi:hypothetical protein